MSNNRQRHKMLATHLKIHKLPEAYAKKIDNRIIPCYKIRVSVIREFVAYTEGEDVEDGLVQIAVEGLHDNYPSLCTIEYKKKDLVNIVAGGKHIHCSRLGLKRRFHFFDDFLSTFPNAVEVDIPYPFEVVRGVLIGASEFDLDELLGCMRYFNPKSAVEYFYFSPGSVSDEVLLELASYLTDDEVSDMIEARYYIRDQPHLPREGRDRPVLAYHFENWARIDRIADSFSSYPSYIVVIAASILGGFNAHIVHPVLCKTDFSNSKEVSANHFDIAKHVGNMICSALTSVDSREDASRLLAMLDIRESRFNNEDMNIVLPYRMKLVAIRSNPSLNKKELMQNLSRLFGVELEAGWSKMKEDRVKKIEVPSLVEVINLDEIDFDD